MVRYAAFTIMLAITISLFLLIVYTATMIIQGPR